MHLALMPPPRAEDEGTHHAGEGRGGAGEGRRDDTCDHGLSRRPAGGCYLVVINPV